MNLVTAMSCTKLPDLHEIFKYTHLKFTVYGRKDRYNDRQCSHASVGLAPMITKFVTILKRSPVALRLLRSCAQLVERTVNQSMYLELKTTCRLHLRG